MSSHLPISNVFRTCQRLSSWQDTGSSNLWIPSVQCNLSFDTGCNGKTKYNHDKSTSYQADTCQALFIPYGTGFVLGYLSTDVVFVGDVPVKAQEFGEVRFLGVLSRRLRFQFQFQFQWVKSSVVSSCGNSIELCLGEVFGQFVSGLVQC